MLHISAAAAEARAVKLKAVEAAARYCFSGANKPKASGQALGRGCACGGCSSTAQTFSNMKGTGICEECGGTSCGTSLASSLPYPKGRGGLVFAPTMPCLAARQHQHRMKNVPPPLFNACVARMCKKHERLGDNAKAAIDKEWSRLRAVKYSGGTGCWGEGGVREWREVAREAIRASTKVHVGRVFDILAEKGSELPDGHADKKMKCRAVYQGNQVKDENWESALFNDLTSSPATMEASKAADVYGLLEGNDIEVADADQAYTQSVFKGTETWVRLPREQWPQDWIDRGLRDPVCPL